MRPISSKVVVITGAARGIGLETARAVVARGGRVAIGDRDVELALSVAEPFGDRAFAARLDVTDRGSFTSFLDAAEDELGPIDVLVNNAGIMPVGPFHLEPDEVARHQVAVNVHGVILGSKLALARMLPRRRGHIVNLASAAGFAAVPGVVTYSGTKHAVVGITEGIRLEYRGSGVTATAVLPGAVQTELTHGMREARALPKVPPSVVAAAVVDAIQRPRARVFVPARVGTVVLLAKLLPGRAIDMLTTVTGTQRGLLDTDVEARRAYVERTTPS